MTRCPVHGEDHTPPYTLPPLLARFECHLAYNGVLIDAGLPDPELPWKKAKMPGRPMQPKSRARLVWQWAECMEEVGYLKRDEAPGRYTTIEGKDVRDLSLPEIRAYLASRFSPDVCRAHREGCRRCCRPHHVSSYNWVCSAFRKMAEWLYFSERAYNKPAWSKQKLREVYAATPKVQYKLRPPEINKVERAVAFREWLERVAPEVPQGSEQGAQYAEAIQLYKRQRTKNAAEIARRLGVPHMTVYYWVRGRSLSPEVRRVRAEMARAYAYELWWTQQLDCRYEEMAHAEYPLDGSSNYWARLNRDRGTLFVVGKGVEGKGEEVPLTTEELAKVEAILAWRAELGRFLKAWTGRDPDPVLFVSLSDRRDLCGRRLGENPRTYNRTLRRWAERYNAWLEAQGRGDERIDPRLVSSHKIGRATGITRDSMDGVVDVVGMKRARISSPKTFERYKRPDVDAMRRHIEEKRAGRSAAGDAPAGTGTDARLARIEGMMERALAQNEAKDRRVADLEAQLAKGRRRLPSR